MSQADLAKRLGVTQQCVSEWELNRTEPTLTYLCMMADVFEISLDVLCGRVEL
ncbi:MAG: helix-turn-helix domain-containing protein [Clostridiales bacterium]|nr:helix-turn-helix domain-containing protein [Clostridiales bacterium]